MFLDEGYNSTRPSQKPSLNSPVNIPLGSSIKDSISAHISTWVTDPVYGDFKTKLTECTITAVCGRSFVLVERLTRWLLGVLDSGESPLSRLIKAIDFNCNAASSSLFSIPTSYSSLYSTNDLLILCILLDIGHGEFWYKFRELNSNKTLPLDLRWLRSMMNELRIESHEDIAAEFDKAQWKYCPATVELNMRGKYLPKCIMPYTRKERINFKGGTASLWQVEIPEEFVGPELRMAARWSKYHEEKLGHVSIPLLSTCLNV